MKTLHYEIAAAAMSVVDDYISCPAVDGALHGRVRFPGPQQPCRLVARPGMVGVAPGILEVNRAACALDAGDDAYFHSAALSSVPGKAPAPDAFGIARVVL